jgi:MarR family transcriptional regulator, lower aerobic nicotinate degradation pathway regulator
VIDAAGVTPARLRQLPTWLLSQANVRSHRLVVEALGGSDSRGYHFRILAALDDLGPCSQADLGRAAGLDRSDVAVTVDDLERRRAIRRGVDPADRRRKRVAMTPVGQRLLLELDEVLRSVQDRLLEPLSPAERATFVALLERLQP